MEVSYNLSVSTHKELGEIPWDVPFQLLLVSLQVLIYWMGVRTIDINFGEHGKLDTKCILGKLLNSSFRIGLLLSKLVAWECKHIETLVSILLVDFNHPSVVAFCKSSLCCDVDEDNRFFTSH